MIAIVDYGMGNLRSVAKALERFGYPCTVTADPHCIAHAKGVILPGVGAFGEAAFNLRQSGLVDEVMRAAKDGRPFLGICLGYQLLFEESEEAPGVPGLGIFPGRVKRFAHGLKIPHMGWNSVEFNGKHPITTGQKQPAWFYFVHSYYVEPADQSLVVGRSEYGIPFAAAIASGNLFACQFHPEKSQSAGLSLIKRFGELSCV
ncbi:MAG TPA: imidazole glycerol phosphate synthase subunit HisH [Spirochaetota bacterium]|nr:imidazole glycerol phosphate synthase subunit HisH [Spirochaetota bacterium]HPH01783.1 imidazole glycerol phosphate synthase subunit HisH [Spirochaetota bacterium]